MRRLLLVGIACLGPASGLDAQETAHAALTRVRSGAEIRLAAHRERIQGRLTGLDGGTVRLERPAGRIEVGAIDSVWTKGHATLFGAVVGAAVWIAAVQAFAAGFCDASECETSLSNRLAYTGVAAAGGALIGAGVGALIPRWRLRYARPGSAMSLRIGPAGPDRFALAISIGL